MATPQEKMKATLEKLDIPAREIKVYGSQITVECLSLDAANRWAMALGRVATVKGVVRSLSYAKSEEHLPSMLRKTINVWRTYATI